jgi:D-alanyl-D-alanine endopeptidase (penicillin-binding protein 7)
MSYQRSIAAFVLACIIFIILALGLRIAQSLGSSVETAKTAASQNRLDQPKPAVDGSFFSPLVSKVSALLPGSDSQIPTTTSASGAATPAEAQITPSAPPAIPPADTVTAEAYLVGDAKTGRIYLEKNSGMILPVASMSKLITAIAATDRYSPTTTIEITEPETQVPPDPSGLTVGENFTVAELLYPLLMDSSNVAADALASSTGRIDFLESMSSYAWEIGMPHAFFADPSGLSERNAGTAVDFFALARYLYLDRPDILAVSCTIRASTATTTSHGAHDFVNIHPFVNDKRFLGGKTGHTLAALDTMLTIMNIAGHPIAVIVLRSYGERARDTSLLIDKVSTMLSGDTIRNNEQKNH